jgi:hypothetical protein
MLPRCNGINAVGLTLAATFKIWRAALAVRQRFAIQLTPALRSGRIVEMARTEN